MKKITIYIVMALLCLNFSALGQSQGVVEAMAKGIQVGQVVPDEFWSKSHLLWDSGELKTIRLSKFKGKLLILDFWATWCSACIGKFTYLDSIQSKYSNQFELLKVGYQKQSVIADFFVNNNPKGDHYVNRSLYEDNYLRELFPHHSLPHYVWIGPDGKVLAITGADQMNESNILAAAKEAMPNMPVKIDLDISKPIFQQYELLKANEVMGYSILVKGSYSGLSTSSKNYITEQGHVGKNLSNMPLLQIYEVGIMNKLFADRGIAYSKKRRIIAEGIEGALREFYSYSKQVPSIYALRLETLMLNELNLLSGYCGRIEKRKINCLVLTISDKKSNLHKSLDQAGASGFSEKADKLHFTNLNAEAFVGLLNTLKNIGPLVLDETAYKGKLSLVLESDASIQGLQRELASQNLKLSYATREVDVFVLEENNRRERL